MFPYNDEEEFRNNKFYKSIEEVNIGAIPFLPSTTKLMESFLDDLVNESSYSTFERALQPIEKENYLKDEYFSNREVLVGALKSKDQLEVINVQSDIKAFNLEGINIVINDEGIISIAEETVVKVSKDDFIKKPIKSIKELLRK